MTLRLELTDDGRTLVRHAARAATWREALDLLPPPQPGFRRVALYALAEKGEVRVAAMDEGDP